MHYDIEPYLLAEYSGAARWPIFRAYLQLLGEAHTLATSEHLLFEVAIPFWFDTIVIPPARESDSAVLTPLSEQIIDRTDSVALMDYRTMADGPNGTVAHGASELRYASASGRRVMLGLETVALPDRDVYRFYGQGMPGLPTSAGDKMWVVTVRSNNATVMHLLQGAGVQRLREEVVARTDTSESNLRHWEILVRVPVPATGITFYDLGAKALRDVIDATRSAARRYPAFGGIAIHYYTSYRRLLKVEKPDTARRRPDVTRP